MKIAEILDKISKIEGCKLLEKTEWVKETDLPEDLEYFFNHYGGIELFTDKPYGITIVGGNGFTNANKTFFPEDDVIWDELEDDISNSWYIIAKAEHLSQYISMDTAKERLGWCYDSFTETHATEGESPIIAKSFTELLERLLSTEGDYWFWLEDDFKPYGDAYPEKE